MSTEHDPAGEKPIAGRALLGLVQFPVRYPVAVLVVAGALAALSVYAACTRLTFLTQRDDLVSPKKEYQQRWRQYVEEFGDDDDMVVVVQGGDPGRMEEAIETVAARLHARPELFDRVFYKVDLRGLRDRALMYLSVEQVRRIQDNLKDMDLLLTPPFIAQLDPLFGWRSLTLNQLVGEAERRAAAVARAGAPSDKDREFFRQLAAVAGVAADALGDAAAYASPWRSILPAPAEGQDLMDRPQFFFSGDRTLAFLLVRPVKNMASFTSAQESIRMMREILVEVEPQFPGLDFGLTGLPVLENDEMVASQADTTTASWLALVGVALLYLVVYRGIRYPALTVATLIVGTLWALGWCTLTVGHLNILSATFAVMLIGMGDYGVLWVTRYEQDRAGGAGVAEAIRGTTGEVGPSILTAAVTTALAFFTAMLADFRAVAELGWIAGSGVLLCALSCFTVLPALVRLIDRKDAAPRAAVPLAARAAWLPAVSRRPRWVIAAVVLLTATCAVFASKVRYDHNLLHLQARGLDSVRWELTLIRHTAGASWHALSYTDTPEEALALKARYEKLPGVSRVVEVASLVPRDQNVKLELLRDVQRRLRNLPGPGQVIAHARPDPDQLSRRVSRLLTALAPLARAGEPAAAELRGRLRALRDGIHGGDPDEVGRRLQAVEERMAADLAGDLHRLRDVSRPVPITVMDLPTSLRERYVGKSGKWLLRVFGDGSLWEYGPLRAFVARIKQVDPEASGKPFSTLEGLEAMREGFKWAGVYALVAMVVVLLLDFRNVWHTGLALLPLAIGVVVSLGVMGLFGLPLNPANMIALPLILGVGADNGVHILHDYLSRGGRRRYCLSHSTGRGIMVAALTTILGFGTLTLSHHRGLAGLGLLLTIGVGCCMLAALVVLPGVLRLLPGPDGETPAAPVPGKAA